ncbi:MAG: ArsR/SmtB family transcription factor [Vicinamibacteria bacterium]
MVEYSERLDRTFTALADPTRRAILARLSEGPLRVTEIAAPFDMSLNAVSKHLKLLERAKLVEREVRGREHFCSLDARPLSEITDWTAAYREFWEARLDALERLLLARRGSGGDRGRRRAR